MTKGVFETLYLFKRDFFFATAKKMLTGVDNAFCIPRERLPSVQRAIGNSQIRFWTNAAEKHFYEWASEEPKIKFQMPIESGWLDFTETPEAIAWGDCPGFVIGEFFLTDDQSPYICGHTGQGYFWVSAEHWTDWYSLRPAHIEIIWNDDKVNFRSMKDQATFDDYVRSIADKFELQSLRHWEKIQARGFFINTTYPVIETRRPDRGLKGLKGAKKRNTGNVEPAFSVIVKRRPEKIPDLVKSNQVKGVDSGRLPNILHIVSEFTRMQWYPSEKTHRPVVIKEFLRGTDDPTRQRPTRLVKVAC